MVAYSTWAPIENCGIKRKSMAPPTSNCDAARLRHGLVSRGAPAVADVRIEDEDETLPKERARAREHASTHVPRSTAVACVVVREEVVEPVSDLRGEPYAAEANLLADT